MSGIKRPTLSTAHSVQALWSGAELQQLRTQVCADQAAIALCRECPVARNTNSFQVYTRRGLPTLSMLLQRGSLLAISLLFDELAEQVLLQLVAGLRRCGYTPKQPLTVAEQVAQLSAAAPAQPAVAAAQR